MSSPFQEMYVVLGTDEIVLMYLLRFPEFKGVPICVCVCVCVCVCACVCEPTLLKGWRAVAYSFIRRESRDRRDSINSFTSSCSVSAYLSYIFRRTLL